MNEHIDTQQASTRIHESFSIYGKKFHSHIILMFFFQWQIYLLVKCEYSISTAVELINDTFSRHSDWENLFRNLVVYTLRIHYVFRTLDSSYSNIILYWNWFNQIKPNQPQSLEMEYLKVSTEHSKIAFMLQNVSNCDHRRVNTISYICYFHLSGNYLIDLIDFKWKWKIQHCRTARFKSNTNE